MPDLGKVLILAGLLIAGLGILFSVSEKMTWFGRLPGDCLIQKGNFSFYFPLTTSILVSVLLTVVFWLLKPK